MFSLYTSWVTTYPVTSAAIQFALLGTTGECLSCWIRTRRHAAGCTVLQLVGKMLGWALLGILIKYAFTGMRGFVAALTEHGMLPWFFTTVIGSAFAVSVVTNVLFGPQMMLFHRLEDNLVLRQWNWQGMHKAIFTLVWFWIPAHTITFALPRDYQIGLAALWSVVLGLILGLSAPRTASK